MMWTSDTLEVYENDLGDANTLGVGKSLCILNNSQEIFSFLDEGISFLDLKFDLPLMKEVDVIF